MYILSHSCQYTLRTRQVRGQLTRVCTLPRGRTSSSRWLRYSTEPSAQPCGSGLQPSSGGIIYCQPVWFRFLDLPSCLCLRRINPVHAFQHFSIVARDWDNTILRTSNIPINGLGPSPKGTQGSLTIPYALLCRWSNDAYHIPAKSLR